MFGRLFGRRRDDAIASEIYGAIVAWARARPLYADLGVPDTVAGRFEMLVLHLAVAMARFGRGSAREQELGQLVFDIFCTDMDRSLREFGVSDVVIGKRMKRMGQAYYGRSGAYLAALDAGDRAALAEAIGRNVFPRGDRPADRGVAERALTIAARLAEIESGGLERDAAATLRSLARDSEQTS